MICLIWKQWRLAIRNLRFIWGEMRFFIGCLHLDAICPLYCGRRGGGLAPFYSKFVTEPIQEQKVNTGIYLHARKRRRWGDVGGLWRLLRPPASFPSPKTLI